MKSAVLKIGISQQSVNTMMSKAFELKGFTISYAEHACLMEDQIEAGKSIFDSRQFDMLETTQVFAALPQNIHSLMNIAYEDFYYMAGFGYLQGILIHQVRQGDPHCQKLIGTLTSLFNIGITFFDYLVDDLCESDLTFDSIDWKVVRILLKGGNIAIDQLLYQDTPNNKRIRFLMSIIGTFGRLCNSILRRNGIENLGIVAWRSLCRSIYQLYNAEKNVCLCSDSSSTFDNSILKSVKCKSSMPFLAMYYVSLLSGSVNSQFHESQVRKLSNIIGQIFWICDDLSDFISDLRNHIPSSLTIKVLSHKHSDIESNLLNTDFLFSIIVSAIERILNLFEKLLRIIQSLPISNTVSRALARFVRMNAAVWLGCYTV